MARSATARNKAQDAQTLPPFASNITLATPLVGHHAQQAALAEALSSGRMHHGWLLHGPQGIGKARFALQASAFLIAQEARKGAGLAIDDGQPEARLIAQNAHPDAIWLDRLTGLVAGRKLPKTIPVAAVRDALQKLQSTAAYGGWRTLVVDAVDDLNAEGANALLKPLEEPPRHTVLFLIAHRLSAVLPTLRSRCRLLAFAPLSGDEVAQVAAGSGATGDAAPEAIPGAMTLAAALAGGRAGVVQHLLATPDLLDAYGRFCALACDSDRASISERLTLAGFTAGLADADQRVMLGLIDDWFSRRITQRVEPAPLPTPAKTVDLAGRRELAELWSAFGADLAVRRAINLDVSERIMALFDGLDRVYSGSRSS